MANCTHNLLDFQDPGALPKELMQVPGFVNGLKEHTMAIAARPNEPLAFAGALAMLAHLGGRTYRDERGGRTNLYLAALAPSGMGKEEPREVNKRLAAEAGILDTLPDSVASGQALEDAVGTHPSTLLQCDEADTLLSAMRSGDGRTSRLSEMVLRFFGEAKGVHAMRQFAGDTKVRNIVNPHLTLFATGIPKYCYAALNEKSMENGLLGRCLFLDTEEFCPLGEMKAREFPTELVDTAKWLAAKEKAIEETGVIDPIVVPDTPDAKRKIAELKFNSDEMTRRLMNSGMGTSAAICVRIPEKALKLALIWAISENPEMPRITADGVIWATRFVSHLTKRMLYLGQFYMAEGKFDRLKKRALGMMAKNGGQIDRSTLLRSLHVDSQMLQKIILTLHMCDMIEEERLSARTVIYTLKGAA